MRTLHPTELPQPVYPGQAPVPAPHAPAAHPAAPVPARPVAAVAPARPARANRPNRTVLAGLAAGALLLAGLGGLIAGRGGDGQVAVPVTTTAAPTPTPTPAPVVQTQGTTAPVDRATVDQVITAYLGTIPTSEHECIAGELLARPELVDGVLANAFDSATVAGVVVGCTSAETLASIVAVNVANANALGEPSASCMFENLVTLDAASWQTLVAGDFDAAQGLTPAAEVTDFYQQLVVACA